MMSNMRMVIYKVVGVILGLVGVALGFSIWLGIGQSFRIVFGSVYVLFLPGLVLTFVFFKKDEIDIIERIALSFALSIAVVPLLVFYLNLMGVKINILNVSLIIAGIIILGLGVIFRDRFKRFKIKDNSSAK